MTSDDLNRHIGRAVRDELWERHITQRALAEALGVNESAVSRLLRGNRKWEVSEVLVAAEVLDVPVAALLPEPLRQGLVSVGSGPRRSVSRGRRTTGWFRLHVAKQRAPILLAYEHNHPSLAPIAQVARFPSPRQSLEHRPVDPYHRAG